MSLSFGLGLRDVFQSMAHHTPLQGESNTCVVSVCVRVCGVCLCVCGVCLCVWCVCECGVCVCLCVCLCLCAHTNCMYVCSNVGILCIYMSL